MKSLRISLLLIAVSVAFTSCGQMSPPRLAEYATVRLTADLSSLSEGERKMIPLLIEASKEMDKAFWIQAAGEVPDWSVTTDELRRYYAINYGPWDRLNDNAPFLHYGPKPLGAGFYPSNMSKEEFEEHIAKNQDDEASFRSLYTMIRRDENGKLRAIPYHEYFDGPTRIVAAKLEEAAALAEDPGLKKYLELRSKALLTSDYQASDMAWMDMKDNGLDVVIGPIETYEDKLYGYKAAYESYILVKDREWSARLSRYAKLLPELQRGLPVPDAYKAESPGSNSDLNAYDVIYYAGDCNAGSKTIAINLPNDEEVQKTKGSRRLQLKNAMRAKFDRILVPIAGELIADDQVKHVTFDAFFGNVMFHEVAHGLGIKDTINGRGTVRTALKEQSAAVEEGKADVLGLYMIQELRKKDLVPEGLLMDNYVTFLAGIFRSVRFGAASAHGKANTLRFNFFQEQGAFRRDEKTGKYSVVPDKMGMAVTALSRIILLIQGNGDYVGAKKLIAEKGGIGRQLRADLDQLADAGIPVDIVFEQGLEVLGLK